MSDVSGIPYMGPMGQGNFFAPTFSYNPQMSAGQIQSAYMPEFYNNQNTLSQLYGSGPNQGFGVATDYYAKLGAQYLAQVPMSWENPYRYGGVPASLSMGSYTGPPQTSTVGGAYDGPMANINNNGGWNQSIAGPNWLGGGGFSSGGLGGFSFPQSQSSGPAIDWGGVGQAAASLGGGGGGGGGGMGSGMLSGLGGLGGAGYTPSSSLDWSRLFDGGGGARADPYPGMTMPGGLSSPINAQQQQPIDYGSLFGRGVGGTDTAAASTPMTYDQMGQAQRDLATVSGAGPGLGGAPAAAPDIQRTLGYDPSKGPVAPSVFDTGATSLTGTQDTGPYGGGAGIGGLDTGRAIGEPYTQAAEPQRGMLGTPVTEAYNPYFNVTGGEGAGPPTDTRTGGALTPGGGLTATDLSAQARARLAELIAKPKEPGPDEVFAGDKPVPTEGQPGLPPTEPSAPPVASPANSYDTFQAGWGNVVKREAEPTGLSGRQDALATLKKELQAQDLIMTSGYRDPTHPLSEAYPGSAHSQGRAFDVRAQTPEQADVAMGQIRELLNARGLVEGKGKDYQIIDEVRNPSPWATGPHVHTQFTEEGMQRYQSQVYQDPNPPRPPADIPYPGGVPLPADRPDTAGPRPAEAAAPPLPAESPATQAYPGADAPRPPADIPDPRVSGAGFNALDAAAPHTGLELARANMDTPIERIAMERGGQKAVDQISSLAMGKTPRELAQSYGSMFFSNAEPLFKSLGITRQDFDKAAAMPQAKQDVKMRFDGGFGGMGGELPSPGAFTPYEGWRQQSPDFEYRGDERPGRDQLAQLQTQGTNYELPEVAPTPIGRELGLEDLAGGPVAGAVPGAAGPGVDAQDFLRQLQEQSSPSAGGTGAGTPAGNAYWDIPKEGTPRYNAEVYEPMSGGAIMRRPEQQTIGGASHYENFPRRSEDVEDRTNEVLGSDQRAALKAMSSGIYYSDPEPAGAASNPLAIGLGLGDRDLPMPAGSATGGMARTRGVAGDPERDTGPRSSTFGFDPGGFGEGGYGNIFAPNAEPTAMRDELAGEMGRAGMNRTTMPRIDETTNLTPGPMSQSQLGDPFNPENYNTLDQALDLAQKRAPHAQELLSNPNLMEKAKAVSIAEIGPDLNKRTDADIAGFFETMLNNMATGARSANFPTLESYLSPKGYYEPIRKNQPSMGEAYKTLQNDPALSARIDRIFQEVVKGSNVSGLSTQNSVQTGKFGQGGEGALLPQYGGVMGQFVPGPGEYYTSMLNPYNNAEAKDYIGAGAQPKYREFYRSLTAPGQMPWERR